MKQILVDLNRCLGCESCEIACAVSHSDSKNIFGAIFAEAKPHPRISVEAGNGISFPLQCRQCEEPKCVQACMSGAMFKDTVSGLVANNPDRCVGCWMCVMVCPFGVITQDLARKTATKCDRCPDLAEPACIGACPTKALKFTEIEEFNKNIRKQFLTNFRFSEEGQ